jgi:hypothetical protein
MKPFNIDKIIYPVKTKRGIKMAPPEAYSYQNDHVNHVTEKLGRLLDGFLILYSCRVKMPHEAITSKLASQSIVDVI